MTSVLVLCEVRRATLAILRGYRRVLMKVLMISGWKGSGKDTVAEFLIKEHGFKRVAFADPLKDMVAEEYGIPREWCDDRQHKEAPLLRYRVSPKDSFSRTVAETMALEFRTEDGKAPQGFTYENGEFYGVCKDEDGIFRDKPVFWTPRALCILKGSTNRSVTSSYWIKRAVEGMLKDDGGLYVISDARYRSEISQVSELVGKEKVTSLRVNRFDSAESVDSSERDLDNYEFDVVVENRSTKEELFRKVRSALKL